MKSAHILLLVATMMLPLGGCVIKINGDDKESDHSNWKSIQQSNVKRIKQLELGRSLGSIESEFGTPDIVESFQRDGNAYKVWFYRTRHVTSDGMTRRDETTPLVFIDEELVGWGESAIDKAAP